MAIKKVQSSLMRATQVNRVHPREMSAPQLYKARNLYVEKGDMALTLRPDINELTSPTVYDLLDDIGTGGIASPDNVNYLNSIAISQKSDNRVFITRLAPVYENSESILSSTWTAGTVTTDGTTSKVVGSGSTNWLRYLWKHCLVRFSTVTKLYRISHIESNGVFYVDGIPPAYSGVTYTVYRVHDGNKADYPVHLEPFLGSVIYNAVDPTQHTEDAAISGPFRSPIERSDTPWNGVSYSEAAATNPVSNKTIRAICSGTVDSVESWVIVGDAGKIYTSFSGATWVERTSGVTTNLKAVAWNGSMFMAVGERDTVLTSTDGVTWTNRSGTDTSYTYLGVAYNSSLALWAVVGSGMVTFDIPNSSTDSTQQGQALIRTSADSGVTWTTRLDGADWDVGFPECHVAKQIGGVSTGALNAVTSAGSNGFIAVGAYGCIVRSTNGVSWAQVWYETAYGGAVPGMQYSYYTDSLYGSQWRGKFGFIDLKSVAYDADATGPKYCAVGGPSPSGNLRWDANSSRWIWQNGDSTYSHALYSTDGITWSEATISQNYEGHGNSCCFHQLGAGSERVSSVGASGQWPRIYYAAVGMATWTKATTLPNEKDTTDQFVGVANSLTGQTLGAVTRNGKFYTSGDGLTWALPTIGGYMQGLGVAVSGTHIYVPAGGISGTPEAQRIVSYLSNDTGVTWAERSKTTFDGYGTTGLPRGPGGSASPRQSLGYLTFNSKTYLCGIEALNVGTDVATQGVYFFYSLDHGASWAKSLIVATAGTSSRWASWAASNGTTVIVSGSSGVYAPNTDVVCYSSTNGTTWTPVVVEASAGLSKICGEIIWSDTPVAQFVMEGYAAGMIFTSPDGTNWTKRTTGTSITGGALATDNTAKYVWVKDKAFAYSTDAINWTEGALSDHLAKRVIYFDGKFVSCGLTADGAVYVGSYAYSADGVTWTEKTYTTSYRFHDLAGLTGGSSMIFVGYGDTTGAKTNFDDLYITIITDITDASSGTQKSITRNWNKVRDVCQGTTETLAVGDAGLALELTTSSATMVPGFPLFTCLGCTWDSGNSQWVVVGDTGAIYTAASLDGPWQARTSGTSYDFYSVAAGGGIIVAVGDNGQILTSPTGATWTERHVGASSIITKVRYLNSKFIACGDDGIVYTSANGTTWTAVTIDTSIDLNDVAYGATYYVLVGSNGAVYKSTDLATWTIDPIGSSDNLKGIVYTGSEFWIVSAVGANFASTDAVTWQRLDYGLNGMRVNAVGQGNSTIWAVGDDMVLRWKQYNSIIAGFAPLSETYRSHVFAVVDGYVILFGTYEWDSTRGRWFWNKRRIRWTAPMTYNDFTTAGQAGTAEALGDGDFVDARTVGHIVVIWETNCISTLSQTGVLEDPWNYMRGVKTGNRIISNPIVVNDMAYWVASDGMLYATNGVSVESVTGPLDVTPYGDLDDSGPIWVRHDETSGCLIIMKPAASGEQIAYMYNIEGQCLTEITLPVLGTNEALSARPKSLITVPGGWVLPTLMVGYQAYYADQDRLLVGKFNYEGVIKGTDALVSDRHWYAEIQTGFERLVPPGDKTSIKQILVQTYAQGTDCPKLVLMGRGSDESSWDTGQGDLGTISVGTSTCVGTGTVWSHILAVGTGAVSVYTLPLVGGRYTFSAENSGGTPIAVPSYTLSGATLTFAAPFPSGYKLLGYWTGEPDIQIAAGDFVYTTEGFHPVVAITDTYHVTPTTGLSWFPSTTLAGTRYKSYALSAGEDEICAGLPLICDALQLRIVVVPQDSANAATNVKLLSFTVYHAPSEDRQQK